MTQLGFVIMSPDFYTKLNLFDFCVMLLAFFFLLGQFILIFSKISNMTDRRSSIGRNLDEIESIRFSLANGIFCFDDAELLASRTNDGTNFASANSFVDADEVRVNKRK